MRPNYSSITGIKNLSRSDIDFILDLAEKLEPIVQGKSDMRPLKDKVLCTFFYEPSTRTRLSFESAMNRLGGCPEDLLCLEGRDPGGYHSHHRELLRCDRAAPL